VEFVGCARVVLERRHRRAVLHHVDDRLRLTGLGGKQVLQLVGAVFHALDGGGQDRGALLGLHVRPRPLVEGLARGRACGVHVGFVGQRHLAHHLAGGG
jgi:hypothetical protein